MENNSWIALYRELLDDPLWLCERFTKGQAWIDLILRANYANGEVMIGNKTVIVQRGQLLTSQASLALRWKWSRETVSSFLKTLKQDKKWIDYKADRNIQHGNTVITIQNYDKRQFSLQQNRQQTQQQTDSNPDTNNKNNNNNKLISNKDETFIIPKWDLLKATEKNQAIKDILQLKPEKSHYEDGVLQVLTHNGWTTVNDPIAYWKKIQAGQQIPQLHYQKSAKQLTDSELQVYFQDKVVGQTAGIPQDYVFEALERRIL